MKKCLFQGSEKGGKYSFKKNTAVLKKKNKL